MKAIVTGTFAGSVARLRAAWWRRHHHDFLVMFNWHQITPTFIPSRHHRFTWTQLDAFEAEVAYLAREFEILPLHEAVDRLRRGTLRGACASLTFDDGDVSMADYVAPFLSLRGLPATFFINTAYLDGHGSYWFPVLSYLRATNATHRRVDVPAELLEEALQLRQTRDARFYNEMRSRVEALASLVPGLESRLVSPQWLAGLDRDQFAIGAHGHEHERFSMMSADWQRSDLRENLRRLSAFRAFRPIFAVPFGREGDWTDETLRIAHDHGLEVLLADGGLNVAAGPFYRRIPSDSRTLRPLVAAAMCG